MKKGRNSHWFRALFCDILYSHFWNQIKYYIKWKKKKKYAVISQQKKRCPIMTPDDAQSPFGLLLAGSSNISDRSHFIPSIGELSCGECRSWDGSGTGEQVLEWLLPAFPAVLCSPPQGPYGLYPKNSLHWTGVQSNPVFFFPLFFKAEFENCNTLLIMVSTFLWPTRSEWNWLEPLGSNWFQADPLGSTQNLLRSA